MCVDLGITGSSTRRDIKDTNNMGVILEYITTLPLDRVSSVLQKQVKKKRRRELVAEMFCCVMRKLVVRKKSYTYLN